ncbi:hypothetical protein AVEN_214004-1 [Araneus ventricosus]|uniref:BTB domain-containing protein n=1 Tax=Araneus ventricosus TaxID=182803 RepID=A0A4Y2NXK6_ARAVE|nr:hypothetical protein AVEN_214004-1 [Araneus ventricosus]
MDDKISDSDIFSQVDDVKDIQIKKFSCVRDCQNEHIHFVRKKNFYGQLYAVHVYPDGISSENQGYVSIKVSKVLKDPDTIPDVGYDNITWTFSVVDVGGHGRYYQSVVKESVMNLPYQIEIPMFLRRSFVLERADELLPGDELTIRCEASFVFYSVQALLDDLVFDVNPYPENERVTENVNEDSKGEESSETDYGAFSADFEEQPKLKRSKRLAEEFEEDSKLNVFSETDDAKFFEEFEKDLNLDESSESAGLTENLVENLNYNKSSISDLNKDRHSYDTEEDITYYILIMLGFFHEYNDCKEKRRLDSKDLEFQIRLLSKILVNTDDTDEIARTYMETDPIFKVYIRLKLKIKDILSKIPLGISEEEDLENEKYNSHPIYTRGSCTTFSEYYSVMKKISEVFKRVTNSSDECGNKHPLSTVEYNYLLKIVAEVSEENPMWEYLFEALRSDESALSDDSDEGDMTDSNCSKDTDWNLQIQTKDGVIFNIPFKEGKETFGSKLVASSTVFESMLRNPMVERLSKKVQLSDIDFRTFRNFLQFLQGSGVATGSFTELCDLYEMADKYNVEDLMFDCGLMFTPFLSEETVSVVEALACMHSDDFLLGAIKSFKNEHSDSPVLKDDGNFVVKRSTNPSLKGKRSDFDFYQ